MQVRSEQRCWQKRKVREEDNNIKKRSKIRGYSKLNDRHIYMSLEAMYFGIYCVNSFEMSLDYGGLTEALKNDRQ